MTSTSSFGAWGWGWGKDLVGGFGFADDFTRANGAIGGDWTGATWTISSNKAINTPTLGEEILANPGFEGVYDDESGAGIGTVNVAPGWSNQGCETDGTDELSESATVHGGAAAQKINTSADGEGIITDAAIFGADTEWYHVDAYINGTSGNVRIVDNAQAIIVNTIASPPATYTLYPWTGRGSGIAQRLRIQAQGGAANFLVDDVSSKVATLSTLFATQNFGVANVTADVDLTIATITQAGLVLNLDSAGTPANFVMAYHNGTKAVLEKCVAGTYTTVITATTAYSANATLRVIKSGTSYSLYYNGAQVGTTQAISDAGIISNTIHGLFSTYSGNTMDNYLVVAT